MRGKGENSHSCLRSKHEAEEDGDLSGELGKWLEDLVVFRPFDWEHVKAQESLLQW